MFSVEHRIDKHPDSNFNANLRKAICIVMIHSYILLHWFQKR